MRSLWMVCAFTLLLGCSESGNAGGSPGTGGSGAGGFGGTGGTASDVVYVQAGAPTGGDGSQARPYADFDEAEEAAGPGWTIYVLPSAEVLDSSITLASGQKLLGLDTDGAVATGKTRVRLTHSEGDADSPAVQLSSGNEIAGLHLVDLRGVGIHGSGSDLSGTYLHHLTVTGAAQSFEILWSILLDVGTASVSDVRITDCEFRDGEDLGGIRVQHHGDSSGSYVMERNEFSDLGGRAYHLLSEGTSSITAEITDSSVDNIGVGARNSDSILPHLRHASAQTVTVRNFHYRNTDQVGSASSTATEAFLEGPPFEDEANYCTGCRLTLEIVDSLYEDPVTDGIQLVNYGSNSVLDVAIRGTQVIAAKPQQVGGGISLIPQNDRNGGSQTRLLIEDSDVVDSTGHGIAIDDSGTGYTAIVDLGGGELGSSGNNRIVGSVLGELTVTNTQATAKNNWWGGEDPRIKAMGEESAVDWQPALEEDPRPGE
jgi:hypothetical protein